MSVFAERRRQLLERLSGVMILPSAPLLIRNNDVQHDYRQDSDFHYLTGFDEPDAVLVLAPKHADHKVVLFVREHDESREVWGGLRAGVEGAKAEYGADAAYTIAEIDDKLWEYVTGNHRLYYRLGRDRAFDERVLSTIEQLRTNGARRNRIWPSEIVDPSTVVHEMRMIKSDAELGLMRRAAEITGEGHLAAMRTAAPGKYEYELEASLREAFRRNGALREAYPPIVASGPNGTILHSRANRRQMRDGELVLVDAGCEHHHYASDVTRTFPVNGIFSDVQRRLYEIVLAAQMAAIEAVAPLVTLDQVHDVAVRALVQGLLREKLLSGERDKIIEEKSFQRIYMHSTSHWLGLDVHDVGLYYRDGHATRLQPGMVITIEPGLYLRSDDEEVPPLYRGIGIRIEDDVLVTQTGAEVLTAFIPKTADEVERACHS